MPRRVATIGLDGHLSMVTRTLTQIEDCHWVAAAKGKPGDNLDAADTGTIINLET